jgi:type I restriction enzyme, S subunit
MASEWQRYEVAELISSGKLVVGDGYRAKNEELGENGLPFARAGNINGGFQFADADRFPAPNLGRVGNKVSQAGDVVFTSKGTVGRFAFVRPDVPQFVYSPQLCFWRSQDQELIDSRFLYYWMHGREFYVQFKGVAGQTDMAEYVSLTDQRRMHITLPDISDQKAIAGILGTLDDKIDLNRRMNETLEDMARALFKSWFVDFDPVRHRVEGRDLKLPESISDLFPDARETTELGEIPKGWHVRPVGDLAAVTGGSTPSTKEESYWKGGTHCWATPKDLSSLKTPVLLDTERKITDAGLSQIASGLLPVGTVLMSSRAPIGYLSIAEVPVVINQGFIAMQPASGVSNLFLLRWAEWAHDLIVSRANGSTFLEISKSNFRPLPVATPPEGLMKAFDSVVRPLYLRMVANELSSRTLAQLRDALLPKLISGEIRIAEVDRILGSSL